MEPTIRIKLTHGLIVIYDFTNESENLYFITEEEDKKMQEHKIDSAEDTHSISDLTLNAYPIIKLPLATSVNFTHEVDLGKTVELLLANVRYAIGQNVK